MKTLSLDIETYSSVDLKASGVYKYAESSDFEVLLFAYSMDGGPVQVVDIAGGEALPREITAALKDEKIEKWAFNAQFERICLSKYLGTPFSPAGWYCTMVWAQSLGLPASLEEVGKVLGLAKQKLSEGKALVKYFCSPSPAGKRPAFDSAKWQLFKDYNARDVETEMGIQKKLAVFPVPKSLWEEYQLDQEINDRGIALDLELVHGALAIENMSHNILMKELQSLTHLENPNSVVQMKAFLANAGFELASLNKSSVAKAIKTAPEPLQKILTLRQKLAKSSVKKYSAMEKAACADARARGMFKFYGASRTGRFAGRLIQLQNLPQNHMPDLKEARALVVSQNYAALELLYDDIPQVLSELVRTAFVPRAGKKFIVADFASIEARILAYIAGEKWRMDAFREGKDIYCSSASAMFGVPVEKNGVNAHLRQKGKVAELALGYGGGVGALKAMGALELGLTEEELEPLVDVWRSANPRITEFWLDVDAAARKTVATHCQTQVGPCTFSYSKGFFFIHLPSGRRLAYAKPMMGVNKYGGECVTYEGVGPTKKWERIASYGPKFTENIVQALARDVLVHALFALRDYGIVAHVHDEIILEVDREVNVQTICEIMSKTPRWAASLVLKAEGYEDEWYRK